MELTLVGLGTYPTVICDYCGKDWTGRDESGGGAWGVTIVCPECEPRLNKGFPCINREWTPCPTHMSFYEFVVRFEAGEIGNEEQ